MKRLLIILPVVLILAACNSSSSPSALATPVTQEAVVASATPAADTATVTPSLTPSYDAPPTITPLPAGSAGGTSTPGDLAAGPDFVKSWSEEPTLQSKIGRPTASEVVRPNNLKSPPAAEEEFRNGYMFWFRAGLDGSPKIYVLFEDNNTWKEYDDTWQEGKDPESPCTDASTPPKRGFAKVWCLETGVKQRLGKPNEWEVAEGQAMQSFEHGLMIKSLDYGTVYTLFDDGTWE